MGDMIDRDAVQSELRAYLVHESSEIALNVEQIIAALPAASSHPLADDARRALEADDVYGWINSLPSAPAEDVRAAIAAVLNRPQGPEGDE